MQRTNSIERTMWPGKNEQGHVLSVDYVSGLVLLAWRGWRPCGRAVLIKREHNANAMN